MPQLDRAGHDPLPFFSRVDGRLLFSRYRTEEAIYRSVSEGVKDERGAGGISRGTLPRAALDTRRTSIYPRSPGGCHGPAFALVPRSPSDQDAAARPRIQKIPGFPAIVRGRRRVLSARHADGPPPRPRGHGRGRGRQHLHRLSSPARASSTSAIPTPR